MNTRRIQTLIRKELLEFRANPGVLFPVVLLVLVSVALPLLILVVVPRLTGETLAADPSLERVVQIARPHMPELAGLPSGAAIEAFMLQQFLILFLLTPVIGAVSLAAYSVVGEKQGRTLEPLLTTPITTAELLVAKVVAALLPSLILEAIGVTAYFTLIRSLASPGVLDALLTVRSALLVLVVGPLTALVALQLTVAVSSRMTDVRSAQQTAVIVVLPIVALLVGQLVGAFIISPIVLVLVAVALAGLWGVLIVVSVALFERETILTRWK